MSDPYITALLHERAGYLAAGKKDRAAEVDKELARVGHKKSAPVESADAPPAAERAVKPARRGRPKKVSE